MAWLTWWVSAALAAPNLVLVSMDTTRVDALSCYGLVPGPARWETRTTPRLDSWVEEGLRFERFWTGAPTTLNAHATMLTGLDPHEHRVVRNGYPFEEAAPTLAERLAEVGYDRIAVVGSAALEAPMGLARGFRVYDDDLPDVRTRMYQDVAEGVVSRTFAALDARDDTEAPVFLFVHFYDAHAPYAPPTRHAERFADPAYVGGVDPASRSFAQFARSMRKDAADPQDMAHVGAMYLAEVAYVDEQIGVLLDGLSARGLLDEALVVVTADHGETLADDPAYAYSHGSNVEEDVMHVPLLMRAYGLPMGQGVVASPAAMTGLAPTLERMLGLERTLGRHPDFFHLVRPGPVRDDDGWPERPTAVALMEASRPRSAEATDRWNNLPLHRGVLAGGYGYWTVAFLPGVEPAWWDLSELGDDRVAVPLRQILEAWDASAPGFRAMDDRPATEKALEALGYAE